MRRLEQSHVPGPSALHDCHRGTKFLGRGNQFEVFGKRVEVDSRFPQFDGPFLNSDPCIRDIVEYEGQSGRKSRHHNRKCVAIKRAKFLTRMLTGPVGMSNTGNESVSQNQLRDTLLEVFVLTYEPIRQHPNVVTLLAWGHDRRGESSTLFSPLLFIEMALMSMGEMCSEDSLTWSLKSHLCHGMICGIRALHEHGIVHGDIKPDNVLIFATHSSPFFCVAKIADFGLSVQDLDNGIVQVQDLPRGTEGWAAPEQADTERLAKPGTIHRCDIWSSALTVWSCMVLNGKVPNLLQDFDTQIAQKFEHEKVPAELGRRLISPLCAMLKTDPDHRVDHFGPILDALEQKTWEDSPESKQK
jgi:serine/threonine protein kinase